MEQSQYFQQAIESAPAETIKVSAGEYLFIQGAVNTYFYQLNFGSAHARLQMGGTQLAVCRLKQHQWIGEIPHRSQARHSYALHCTEDSQFSRIKWQAVNLLPDSQQAFYDVFSLILYRVHCTKALQSALHKLAEQVSPLFIKKMLKYCQFIRYNHNEFLFQQGDKGDGLYLLLNGKLDVTLGNKGALVGEIKRGEIFGEMAVLSGEARTATVRAARASEVVRLSNQHYQLLSKKFPVLSKVVVNTLIHRIKSQNQKIYAADKPLNRIILLAEDMLVQRNYTLLQSSLEKMGSQLISERLCLNQLHLSQIEELTINELSEYLDKQEIRHKINLMVCDLCPSTWTDSCLQRSDEVWLMLNSRQSIKGVVRQLKNLKVLTHSNQEKLKLLLVHPDLHISNSSAWLNTLPCERHYHLVDCQTKTINRVARQLCNKALGLILGGGGAKGFAHIGVLQACEENSIDIDYVGGTSIGAVMGAWIAKGWHSEQIRQAVDEHFVAVNPLGDYTLPLVSLSRSVRLDKALSKTFGKCLIEDLPIPFYCVSSNLSNAQEVVHEQGKLWRAVRASLSIPGVISPVIKNGHYLVDGGLLNNLPCDLMRERNNGETLAVDVSHSEDFLTNLKAMPSPWQVAWQKLSTGKGRENKVPTILDTMLRSLMLASDNRRRLNKEKVDYYISPEVNGFGMLEFTSARTIIQHGYASAAPIIGKLARVRNRDL